MRKNRGKLLIRHFPFPACFKVLDSSELMKKSLFFELRYAAFP